MYVCAYLFVSLGCKTILKNDICNICTPRDLCVRYPTVNRTDILERQREYISPVDSALSHIHTMAAHIAML